MSESQSAYRSIFKATSLFGGVQLFNILVTLIRGKAVALLVGTAGMGLNGLFLSTLTLVRTFTSLGINESAVRDIAKANNSNDSLQVQTTYQVFKRLVWITAILAILVTVLFSPLLSQFSFNSKSYTSSYIWLSITFLFGALSGGIYTLLRGTRQLKYLAQANILGGIIGLAVGLPILYFFGIEGIVPSIIVSAFFNYLASLYFKNKIRFQYISISWKQTFELGKPIILLGLSLTLINLLAAAVNFIVNAYISKTGSLSDLGLYSAGNSIVEGYVGMVFTAMVTDYFPRLSGVIDDDVKWKRLVNEQAELVLILLGIVLILLISTTPLLIRILLSNEFLDSSKFITWAVLAIPLKGISWITGYIILAKGDNKLFLNVEIITNLIVLGLNILFFDLYGLVGLGISLSISYLISAVILILILKVKYQFQFSKKVNTLLTISLISLALCIYIISLSNTMISLVLEVLLVTLTIAYFLFQFNKRINIKNSLISIKQKFKK
jgi:O-antigen/teichoic acid export membrane protein